MSARLLALVPLAVALNVALAFVASQAGLPVYLDTLGTILATLLAGPAAGAAVGLLSQGITAVQAGAYMLAFAPVQLLVVALAWVAGRSAGLATTPRALLWGGATGLAAGTLSALISYAAFRGVTATGVTAITTLLTGAGLTLRQAVVVASVGTDLLDKLLALGLAGVVLRALPERVLARAPGARAAVGRADS